MSKLSVINVSLTYQEISDLVSWLKDEHVRCRRNGITPSPGLTSSLDYLELIDIGKSISITADGKESSCPVCRSRTSTAYHEPSKVESSPSPVVQGGEQLDLLDDGSKQN